MSLIDELKLIAKGDELRSQYDDFTTEFIDKIKNSLKVYIKQYNSNVDTKCPRQISLDVHKSANIKHVVKWLNDEKIPFKLSTEYANGNLYGYCIIFDPKLIISTIK